MNAPALPKARSAAWSELYQRMLKSSLALFMKDQLDLEVSPHIAEWSQIACTYSRVAITAARGHGKSVTFSYAYPIWRAWSEPGCEIYIFSATAESAREFIDIIIYGNNRIKGMVDIPNLAHLVPSRESMRVSKKDRLTRSDVRLTNGSRIRAMGYGKKARGRHPKYIICDDVLNDEDLSSERIRTKNISYFRSAVTNMVEPDGQIINVGTPMHSEDLHGALARNKEYYSKRYPGILDYNGPNERPLFPWRFSLEALKRKRNEIGNIAFTREILVNPISDDLSLFPSSLFPPCYDNTLLIRPSIEQIRERGWTTYMGVDVARSASVGADYFVLFTIGVDDMGNHHIVDIRRHRGMPFRQQIKEIEYYAKYYECGLVLIEANQMQQVWSDELIRTTDVPVKPFVTTAQNKYPLDKGMPSLRILFENGKIVIPRGDTLSEEVTNAWIAEMIQFGFFEGKLQGTGAHDDQAMAFWFAVEAKKAGGFSFAIGDDDLKGEEDDDDFDWEADLLGTGPQKVSRVLREISRRT